jgi:predicted GNAT family acetyltransferase
VLLYSGLSVPTMLTAGDPIDVEAVLAAFRDQLPRRMHGHIRNAHRNGVEAWYDLQGVREMVRMGLSRPQYTTAGSASGAEMLGHRDTGNLMALYQHYPDNFFDPAQLDSGLYYGVRDGGDLVSVAGVHVVSERHDVAAIGNIVTHADHRGRGLASRCVRTILDQLFERVGHVALNVQGDNPSALALYRKFGFTERFGFLESTLTLR